MPRKKSTEVELLPPEDDQPIRGRKKLVEAEHTIKYSAPVPVTVEEETEENDLLFDGDPVDVEKKHKRKTAKTERDDLRKKMMSHGVTAASPLKLIIERYVHSDGPDSGTTAEKSHCTKYGCDEAHVLSQDYMNVAARWGAGRYWFTLYKDGTIVTQWEKKLELPASPIIQNGHPVDPNLPQVIIQGDGQAQQAPMSIKDIMKTQREALKEQLEMAKLMREAYGFAPEQPQQPKTEEEVLTSAILKQPEVVENVVGSVLKRFSAKGSDDGDPWANVAMEVVKSGQAPQIVRELINGLFNGFGSLFPGRQQNGQAQMVEMQFPQGQQAGGSIPSPTTRPQALESNQQGSETTAELSSQSEVPNQAGAQQPSPAEQALAVVIYNCSHKIPPNITADQILKYADALNDQAPIYSIDGYLDAFAKMAPEQAIEFVKTQPNGEEAAKLEHALAWTTELQKIIREANQEGEE